MELIYGVRKMAKHLQEGAVQCQDLQEFKMEAQMSISFKLRMIFEPGLTQIQDGGEIPIRSHCNVV